MGGVATSIAFHDTVFPNPIKLDDPDTHLFKEILRQHAIVPPRRIVWPWPQIESRPYEAVEFIQTQPMATVVQTQVPANCRRYLQRTLRIVLAGRRMSDWRDYRMNLTGLIVGREHDRAGTIFTRLVSATIRIPAPQKSVADDKTWFWLRKTHLEITPYSALEIAAIVSSSSSPTTRISRSLRLSAS